MSDGLHLNIHKKPIDSSYSDRQLTLQQAGDFTVQITEYLALLERKSKLDLTRGRTLLDAPVEKENEEINRLLTRFKTVNWVWSTVYGLEDKGYSANPFVAKGIGLDAKTFNFPAMLEGGGYCYLEACYDGVAPMGNRSHGLLVRAIGTPRIVRIEWTDTQYNPIGNTKIAFGSRLLLHIYTQGLYGQEILIGLQDVNGQDTQLNIANSGFFEREIKVYPVQAFEKNNAGVSGLLVKDDNPEKATTNIQKAVVEVGVDMLWMTDQKYDVFGSFGQELEIKTRVKLKNTGADIPLENDDAILKVTINGERKNYTQEVSNNPVVVGEIDTTVKEKKKPIDFTFGVFLDGTLNNMYNTELRQLAEGKNPRNTTGLYLNKDDALDIYKDRGSPKDNSSSYENDLSNPAILFKTYIESPADRIFKIYIDGIGSNTAPKEQGGTLTKKDYKKDDLMQGPAFGMGSAGIMSRVKKSIEDAVKMIMAQDLDEDHCVGTVTFDVFGFSRGAAAARHFVHVVTHGPCKPKQSLFRGDNEFVKDLQGYDVNSDLFYDKIMPKFGVLGQLLTEAGLMDDALTKVNVRFVGIYDTVPHHGLFQHNDIKDLGLDNVNKADYVVHMVAADEHRANFSLVDISSVSKTSPYSGKKGGIELIYPGVHCDVGGAYEEGRPDNPLRIDASFNFDELHKLREELIKEGWFQKEEIYIRDNNKIITPQNYTYANSKMRIVGDRARLSNQYSYIPLHIMAEFCTVKKLPFNEMGVIDDYKFYKNFIKDNVAFLEGVKAKLRAYTFEGGPALVFKDIKLRPIIDPMTGKLDDKNVQHNIQEKLKNYQIRYLRNHYLHWNSTYGQEGLDIALQTNYPNKNDHEKRQRHVR